MTARGLSSCSEDEGEGDDGEKKMMHLIAGRRVFFLKLL
jgi:hypothetical protein